MIEVKVKTQLEFEAALKAGNIAHLIDGSVRYVVLENAAPEIIISGDAFLNIVSEGSSQPRVVARESSRLCVEARESSQPRVVARGSSQPRVVAWGSSQPRVEARESSQPRVVACGSSQPRVEARDSSQPRVEARDWSQPRVVAWGSSRPRVEAWGSSQPCVEARDWSQPRVEALDSSQPRVEALDSSQPRVVARGSSQPCVVAWGSSRPRVEAYGYARLALLGAVIAKAAATVAVLIDGPGPKVTGGKQTRRPAISTGKDWCEYYGVKIIKGVAILFKSVDDDYSTPNAREKSIYYKPGTQPSAPDWDGGKAECGGGLHFSPNPMMAREFNKGMRYVACPVKVADIVVHENPEYPNKVKAKGVTGGAVYEVDEDGKRLGLANVGGIQKRIR